MTNLASKPDTNVKTENSNNSTTDEESIFITNPLVQRLEWHHELYRRIKLVPWWIKYNIGVAEAAVLKKNILKLASDIGFQDKWAAALIRHAVSEFSKKGLGADYYGYHNIQHE